MNSKTSMLASTVPSTTYLSQVSRLAEPLSRVFHSVNYSFKTTLALRKFSFLSISSFSVPASKLTISNKRSPLQSSTLCSLSPTMSLLQAASLALTRSNVKLASSSQLWPAPTIPRAETKVVYPFQLRPISSFLERIQRSQRRTRSKLQTANAMFERS